MSTSTHRPEGSNDEPTVPAVTRVGNLTADPELRFSKDGKAWAQLRLAVDTPKVAGQWSGPRDTTFYEVVTFDSVARNVCESLTTGCRVIVHGQPQIREYEAKDGSHQVVKRIVAQAIGPELRFARATVVRNGKTDTDPHRATAAPEPEEDPWATF